MNYWHPSVLLRIATQDVEEEPRLDTANLRSYSELLDRGALSQFNVIISERSRAMATRPTLCDDDWTFIFRAVSEEPLYAIVRGSLLPKIAFRFVEELLVIGALAIRNDKFRECFNSVC